MNAKIKQHLAKLVLKVGVNLKKEQCLLIQVGSGNYEYARIIAAEAYSLGARYVRIQIRDNELIKSRVQYSSRENLSYFPRDLIEKGRMELDEDWARIRIDNTEEINVLEDVSATALSELEGGVKKSLSFVAEQLLRHSHAWLVLAVPGPEWARVIYQLPEDASEADVQEALEKLEALYISILRLDTADPVATWKELGRKLAARAAVLNNMKLSRLRFRSAKTDLSVSLSPDHLWCGGPATLPDGRIHEPNLPSEEVFTAPDFRETEGFVQAVRPVRVMGTVVEGAWFRFHEGRVVECAAEKGREVLEKFLLLDEGSSYLGEVALVDVDSPINRSGLVFGSILFDENASCHIALGAGYPICLRNEKELKTPEALKGAGCNVSISHTDFMISNDETNVSGYLADGSEIQIITTGKFVI